MGHPVLYQYLEGLTRAIFVSTIDSTSETGGGGEAVSSIVTGQLRQILSKSHANCKNIINIIGPAKYIFGIVEICQYIDNIKMLVLKRSMLLSISSLISQI